MNTYNRHKTITGLDSKNESHKEVKQTLFALD